MFETGAVAVVVKCDIFSFNFDIVYYKMKNVSCEIEDFVETPLCKLRVILRSRVLRVYIYIYIIYLIRNVYQVYSPFDMYTCTG